MHKYVATVCRLRLPAALAWTLAVLGSPLFMGCADQTDEPLGNDSGGYAFSVVKGFNGAESCLWDPVSGYWYVSNIAPPDSGDLLELDGEGWISRLDKDGDVVDEKWVTGFDTPAGLRISKGVLFVNNLSKVHGIDVETGEVVETHTFPNALLLNDPAIDETNGIVYATDTLGHAIYQFKAGKSGSETELLTSADLRGPNGLLFDDGKLLVASLADLTSAELGPFLVVDPKSKDIATFGTTEGKWDGLEKWQDGYLLSDAATGQLVLFRQDESTEVLFDLKKDHDFEAVADIGVDPERKIICVPSLADSVAFVEVR